MTYCCKEFESNVDQNGYGYALKKSQIKDVEVLV